MDADTLVRAIRAALDETERIATWAAEEVGDGQWQQRNVRIVTVRDRDREVADFVAGVELIDHIVHNDPAAVLRRVAADRRVLARHQPVEVWIGHEHDRELHKVECSTCRDGSCTDDYDMVCGTPDWPCPEIRDLCDRLGINPETETP